MREQTSDIKFFQRLTKSQHYELCRRMNYKVCMHGETLFEQGDEGTTFYVIYRGCCKLYASDESLNWCRTCVATLEDGTCFGELALLGGGHRNASAVFAASSIVFTVEKDAYEQVLLEVHQQEMESIVTFLRSIFLFSAWPEEELRRLASCTTRRRYERNATVVAQGKPGEQLFFILKGQCRVIKRAPVPQDELVLLDAMSKRAAHKHRIKRRADPSPSAAERAAENASYRAAVLADGEEAQAPVPSPAPDRAQRSSMRLRQRRRSSSINSVRSVVNSVRSVSVRSISGAPASTVGEADASGAPAAPKGAGPSTYIEIGHLGQFAYFGELALLRKGNHTASVVTTFPMEVLVLPRHDFNLHVEPVCAKQMLAYADRYYTDNPAVENDVSGLCRAIHEAHHWASYKQRVLDDAIDGRVVDSQQADSLDPAVLESAGELIAGAHMRANGARQRIGPSVPILRLAQATRSQSTSPTSKTPRRSPRTSPRPPSLPSVTSGCSSTNASPRSPLSLGLQHLPRLSPTKVSPRSPTKGSLSSPTGIPRRSRLVVDHQPKFSTRCEGGLSYAAGTPTLPLPPAPPTVEPPIDVSEETEDTEDAAPCEADEPPSTVGELPAAPTVDVEYSGMSNLAVNFIE